MSDKQQSLTKQLTELLQRSDNSPEQFKTHKRALDGLLVALRVFTMQHRKKGHSHLNQKEKGQRYYLDHRQEMCEKALTRHHNKRKAAIAAAALATGPPT